MQTLAELILEAANQFGVPAGLLEKVLNIERVHLYITESSRQSVRQLLRELLQHEVE